MAWRLEPGSDIVVELHMMPTGEPQRLEISVGLFFTDTPPSRVPYMLRLGRQDIDIAPGDGAYVSADSYVLPVDVEVLAVQPHAHYLAKEIRGLAVLPDGAVRWLIYIRRWDFHWHDVYRYTAPVVLPKGTRLEIRYIYDNSAEHTANRGRALRRVTFGQTTASEMGDLWLQVVTRTAEDRSFLDRDYAPKMLREDIAGAEKMLEVDPGNARLHVDLALLYVEDGRIVDAVPHFEQAVQLEPESADARYHLGTALLNQRKFDAAAHHLSLAVRFKSDFPEARNNVGVARYAQGNIDAAIAAYREALRLDRGNGEAHYNLARALLSKGKFDEALRHLREAVAIRPGDAEAHTSLASALASQDRLDEAVLHYRRALQLQPDLPAALVDLAWILSAGSKLDVRAPHEAVQLAERVAELTKYQDATVLETLSVSYAAIGRLRDAVTAAEAALEAAERNGIQPLAEELRKRLETYKSQLPGPDR